MLLALCVAALLCALGVWTVAKAALSITRRLGADPMTVLLWFGLADRPDERPRAPRRQVRERVVDSPASAAG